MHSFRQDVPVHVYCTGLSEMDSRDLSDDEVLVAIHNLLETEGVNDLKTFNIPGRKPTNARKMRYLECYEMLTHTIGMKIL